MESSRILVTGLPKGTTKSDLTIYFQSTRDSGGGDVKEIEIDGRQAVITFEDVQAASRIVGKGKHFLKNCRLIVSLLGEAAEFSTPEDEEDDTLDQLDENCHSLENDLPYNKINQGADARAQLDRTPTTKQSETLPAQQCTVKVTGLAADTSEDLLTNYFENTRRSKGGPISNVDMDRDLEECYITFESADDAARTVENSPHKVGALCLDVSLFEEEEDAHLDTGDEQSVEEANITIIVSGTLPSKDALWNYFENERRSGGGEVLEMDYTDEGDAVITFAEVKDLKRLLEDPHIIDKKRITVVKRPPKKKVPPDPLKVHVQGLNETTSEDCLRFYLEKFSGAVEVSEVYKGSNNNALAVFDVEPDFVALFDKVSKDRKGLEGKHVRLERVPICSCVEVKGLKKETSDDTIELYFENNRKSGGNRVSSVERKEKDEVLVFFEDPSSVQSVIKRSHVLDRQTLSVKPHYPFLGNLTANKTEVSFDAEVFNYIKMNHQGELQAVLDKHKVILELSKDSTVTMFPSERKNDSPQMWQERAGGLESFLKSFKRVEIQIGAELFDEIKRRWENDQKLTQRSSNYLVSFIAHGRCAQIIGREGNVDKEDLRLRELIDAAQKDTELMKSVVEVEDTDIPKSRLTLLKMSGIGEKLQNEHHHLTISFDLKGNRLRLRGPRSVIQQVQLEIYKFTSKVIEKSIELPTNVINVLKEPLVSDFTQSLLKAKEIQALFVYDHKKSSNEVLAVGVGQTSVTEAENVMQNAILERSLHLTNENTLVLEGRQWKDFHSNLASRFKIGIFAECASSTLWVCGIAEDVKTCFDRVKHFLDVNTILHDSFPMDKGTTRFIFEKWGSKLAGIKEDLAACYLDLRAAHDFEGIEVSGTAEGVDQCISKIKELENSVQKDSVSVDKPGMKKFILQEKGSKSLRGIENSNNCVILTTARDEQEISITDVDDTGTSDAGMASAKFMCSYLTTEGKKVSVLKGDITKHSVDAIVNAANSQLQHVGGVALAIVKAGGQKIQSECDEYVRDKGELLEGKAMVTAAGALPCDKVVHTVGPRWDRWESQDKKEKKKRLLSYAISNCLKTATSSRSIAIPAVSSGVYGFPRDLCAEVILDAVLDFCRKHPSCPLSEIHLINNDDPTVMVFVEEMRKRFSKQTTFVDNEGPELAGSGLSTGSTGPKRRPKKKAQRQSTQGIHITVKVGDLAKEKADVLVGTAGQDLQLGNNPCARALSEGAGPILQQQCTKRGAVAEGDIAVLNQTGNLDCRAVIFAVCCNWSSGRGEEVLKGILTKCLQEADKKNMTSIAFAAIGTGILQFPRDKVADIYFDEIMSFNQKHPNTSLKDVRFVLYDKDRPTVQAFQAAELEAAKQNGGTRSVRTIDAKKSKRSGKIGSSSHGSLTFSPVKERSPDHFETTLGSLCFQAQPGDITKETTDAIAVISNCDLDISASGTGAAILRSGGNSIKKECSRKGLQTPGSVIVTKAGNLSARYLYHIVPNDHTPSGIKTSLMQCLQEAENDRISSISFPAIGTGVIGMTAKSCAQVMLTAIQELHKNRPTSLKLIKMTIFQESMITDIRSAMDEASGMKPSQGTGGWRKAFEKVASAFGFGGSEESATVTERSQEVDNRPIYLTIIAGCKKNLLEAMKAVNEMMKENCKQKVIEHEAIGNLTLDHMRRIHTLELRYSVEVTVEKEVERIVLDGQSEDILQVFGDIHEILHEVKKEEHERSHAEVLSKDVQWKYEDKGKFEDYEGDVNAQIELAYQQRKKIVKITMDEEEYEIDFDARTQEDEDGNVSEIRRIDLRKDVEFPNCWVSQPTDTSGREETVHLFQLDPTKNAQEYKNVSDKFHQSCPNNITKIERVQNPTLYGAYAVNKQRMDKAGGEGSNEMCLFHGTKGTKCELINHKGFNRSFCGENAACHGNGVYFALQASYSARSTYSPPDSTGNRYMYLARVLVGEYTVGRQGILTPPVKNANNVTDTYDTVVDNVSNPGIFVVFYDWQCYPEYLITFK